MREEEVESSPISGPAPQAGVATVTPFARNLSTALAAAIPDEAGCVNDETVFINQPNFVFHLFLPFWKLARRAGLKPASSDLEGQCLIHLDHQRNSN